MVPYLLRYLGADLVDPEPEQIGGVQIKNSYHRHKILLKASPKIFLVSGGFGLRKSGRSVGEKIFLAEIFLVLYALSS